MFDIRQTMNELQIRLAAEIENVDRVDEVTRSFLHDAGLDHLAFNIVLVMRELLDNAIMHGCGADSSMEVSYRLERKSDCLEMQVEDKGGGFDWRANLENEPTLACVHGRGMPILNHYCQAIQYNEAGNRIQVKIETGQ